MSVWSVAHSNTLANLATIAHSRGIALLLGAHANEGQRSFIKPLKLLVGFRNVSHSSFCCFESRYVQLARMLWLCGIFEGRFIGIVAVVALWTLFFRSFSVFFFFDR